MNETQGLLEAVIKGLQEKKGKNIVVVDLTHISGSICDYMVVGEGNTPTQTSSLCDSVLDYARREADERPLSVVGQSNAQWIGLDYGTVIVHIFLPELREFYSIETLWEDSKIEQVPDIL